MGWKDRQTVKLMTDCNLDKNREPVGGAHKGEDLQEAFCDTRLTWLSRMSIRVFLAWPIFLMSSSPVPGVINPGVIPPGYGVFSPPG